MAYDFEFRDRPYVLETCYKCGVEFAMPKTLNGTAKRDKQEFFCPNGHGQSYVESEADKLRKRLVEADRSLVNARIERSQAMDEANTLRNQLNRCKRVVKRAKL